MFDKPSSKFLEIGKTKSDKNINYGTKPWIYIGLISGNRRNGR